VDRTVLTYRTRTRSADPGPAGLPKALRKEDAEAFDRLMDKARGLASAARYDPRLDPMGSVVNRSSCSRRKRSET
jgi:hypothetical protein